MTFKIGIWPTHNHSTRWVGWLLVLLSSLQFGQDIPAQSNGSSSNGWGLNGSNHRFQPGENSEINRDNVSQLALKWAYGLGDQTPRSYPHVTSKTIYVGSGSSVLALDRDLGTIKWVSPSVAKVTTAIVRQGKQGQYLYYGADTAEIAAVEMDSGDVLWRTSIEEALTPRYSGTPLYASGKLFVPVSSYEIGLTMVPFYGCCQSSGGLAALDPLNGDLLWYRPSIQEPAKPVGYGFMLVRQFAPSGAPVWSSPTYDPKRNRVYFATGQNYSRPTSDTSDSIIALDAETGELIWVWQATANDAYTLACDIGEWMPNCFEPKGPDVDFGGPPVLVTSAEGQDLLLAGQKSAEVHAIDPENGELVWSTSVGRGGLLGGVHFGVAVNPELNLVYAPISDIYTDPVRGAQKAQAGVHALDINTGEIIWSHLRVPECESRYCWPGVSAALLVTPDLVFGGTLNGRLFALDASTGEELWNFDAKREFDTVNEVYAHGGAFDSHGPMVEGGNLIISSGYSSFGQMGGNALLNFELVN